jgi:hypothetical protein
MSELIVFNIAFFIKSYIFSIDVCSQKCHLDLSRNEWDIDI